MNISLPESMKAWIEEQIADGSYGTAREFFRQLVREAQQRQVREQIDRKLLAAIESGEPIHVTPELWEERDSHLEKRIKQNKKKA